MDEGYELTKALLKGLAYVAENFPDNPRLAWTLLAIGSAMIACAFIPITSPDLAEPLQPLQVLGAIAGGVCLLLGTYVFFRRWVWNRQDRRTPVVNSLNLK